MNKHSREKLDEFIADYNALYQTKFSTKDSQHFYNYYKDISKRIKEREKESAQDKDRVDILLVVNMFLTGFDVKKVNTLYVDKNLRHHGLIQAFSRTNRILNELKSQGNIVCFRNLKPATDDAIALFSNPEAKEEILVEPYESYVAKFNQAVSRLQQIAPSVGAVDDLPSEEEELAFVTAFRELMCLRNVLSGFSDFDPDDLVLTPQAFEDYKSKYLDIHDKVRSGHQKEKVSILEDADFELELIHRDEINVAYILKLLGKLHEAGEEDRAAQRQSIIDLLGGEAQLRSKKELIEKFIQENLPYIEESGDIPEAFEAFWNIEKRKALEQLCEEEQLVPERVYEVIETILFTGREPLRDSIVGMLRVRPRLLERGVVVERVSGRVREWVERFE